MLLYLHLFTVLPATLIGTIILVAPKGTVPHKRLGKFYMLLMLATAIISLFMPAKVGTQFLSHFGWIHLLSLLVLVTVPAAYRYARHGQIAAHKQAMVSLYIGLVIAGSAAIFIPGRFLYTLFFVAN